MRKKAPFIALFASLFTTTALCHADALFTVTVSERDLKLESAASKIYSDCTMEATLKYTNDAVEVVRLPVASIAPKEKVQFTEGQLIAKATKKGMTLKKINEGLFTCNKPEFAMGMQIINPVDLPKL